MQRTGIKEDVIDLIEELRKREMIETNKEVVQYVLGKAQNGEPLSEADQALLDMVAEIESSREEASAGAAIAEGLFGETEEAAASTTTTTKTTSERLAGVSSETEERDEDL